MSIAFPSQCNYANFARYSPRLIIALFVVIFELDFLLFNRLLLSFFLDLSPLSTTTVFSHCSVSVTDKVDTRPDDFLVPSI